jgi:hypothetical protein
MDPVPFLRLAEHPLFNLDVPVGVGLQIVFSDEHLHRLNADDCIAVDCFFHNITSFAASRMSGDAMETTKKPPERFLRSGSLHPAILGCPADSVPVANRAIVIMTLGTMTFKC